MAEAIQEPPRLRPRRLAVVGVVLVAGLAAAWWLKVNGPGGLLPGCTFNKLTGLHCPGCGMTRATSAALDWRLWDAFRYNPVGMIVFPLAVFALGLEALGWVRGTQPRWRLRPGVRTTWVLVITIFGFAILRNLPWWPFTLLAPP